MTTVYITVAQSTKKGVQTVVPACRETVLFVISGVTGHTVGNLVLFIMHGTQCLAHCDTLSDVGDTIQGQIDMNQAELVELFGIRRSRTEKTLRIILQDSTDATEYLNDTIDVLDNPWHADLTAPTPIDPIS